ncbi:MAG: DUF4382 domain-containing protein [Ferruginibacter sp.]
MLTTTLKKSLMAACMLSSLFYISCQKSADDGSLDSNSARLQVRLTDAPNPNLREVWVDIKEIRISYDDTTSVLLAGAHPGVYNLFDLTNGRDTLLADAVIRPGRIGQIRLVLGSNNYVITNTGQRIALTTPSAQQSGLKINVNTQVSGGVLYRLILDFDAAQSVVKAGNSGNYILKPVIRLLSFVPSGGSARGIVVPDSLRTTVYAIQGLDTAASTTTDATGAYLIRDIAAGTYIFNYVPMDTIHTTKTKNVTIILGQTAVVDTVRF